MAETLLVTEARTDVFKVWVCSFLSMAETLLVTEARTDRRAMRF